MTARSTRRDSQVFERSDVDREEWTSARVGAVGDSIKGVGR